VTLTTIAESIPGFNSLRFGWTSKALNFKQFITFNPSHVNDLIEPNSCRLMTKRKTIDDRINTPTIKRARRKSSESDIIQMDDNAREDENAGTQNIAEAGVSQPPGALVSPTAIQLPRTTSVASSMDGGGQDRSGRLKIKVSINGQIYFMLVAEEERVCQIELGYCEVNLLVRAYTH
jgi:hypothetical protein